MTTASITNTDTATTHDRMGDRPVAPTTKAAKTRRKVDTPAVTAPVLASEMRATILQEHLKRGLAIALHAIAPKSSLPILANVLLVAEGSNRLKISATNLEIGIVVTIVAQVKQPGAITLPAKLLADVIGSLPNQPISMEMLARTQSVKLACGQFEATIKGIAAEEFPNIPSIAGQAPTATFAPEALCCAIGQVAFATSGDDNRPALTGVHISLKDRTAAFTATDSFRLCFRDIVLEQAVLQPVAVIVPGRAMDALGKVLADAEGAVELRIDDNAAHMIVRTDEVELIARCIDGNYPDGVYAYKQRTFETVLEIGTKELARAIKLASFFAVASANVVRLTLERASDGAGRLTIGAKGSEVGDNTSVHDATIRQGDGGQLAVNVKFLAEAVAAVSTPTLALHYSNPLQPIALRGVGDESYTHVLTPMTLT